MTTNEEYFSIGAFISVGLALILGIVSALTNNNVKCNQVSSSLMMLAVILLCGAQLATTENFNYPNWAFGVGQGKRWPTRKNTETALEKKKSAAALKKHKK